MSAASDEDTPLDLTLWHAATWPICTLLAVATSGCLAASLLVSSVTVACISGSFAWLLFYHLLARIIFTHGGVWARSPKDDPRAFCFVSLWNQFVAYPIMFIALISLRHGDFDAFWSGRVGGMGDMLPRHFYLCMIGYEAKDFWPGMGLNPAFFVHHIFVFAGCGICLAADAGLGLLIFIAVVAESGSGLYNLDALFPGRTSLRTLYMLGMTCSNSFAMWGAAEFVENTLVDLGIRVSYAVVVGLLVILRTAGQVLELRKWRAAPSKALDSISTRDVEMATSHESLEAS